MGFYHDRIYPHIIKFVGNTKAARKARERIVPLAQGIVLEVGMGPGDNLPYYDAKKVKKVIGLEPHPGMIALAKKQVSKVDFEVEFIGLPGEQIPIDDGVLDTVFSMWTLCTIPDPVAALRRMRRVLRPGGQMIFMEHGKAPDSNVLRWQQRMEPLHRRIFGGCHLTRRIPDHICQAGFTIKEMEEGYWPGFPRPLGYCWWGTAVPT